MKKAILSTMGVVALVVGASAVKAQAAATTPDAYVDENQTDPAPLKLREVDGSVRGLGGDPMARVSVSLFTEQGHELVGTVMSDKDGRFKFNKVDKGEYRVVAKVAGLCPANVPILVESSLLAHHRLIITMQPKDIDKCSYGTTK